VNKEAFNPSPATFDGPRNQFRELYLKSMDKVLLGALAEMLE
jgi:hypothetical protein